jgi:hypothetical protein
MSRNYSTCASCIKFPLEASLKTGGTGTCKIRGTPEMYDNTACVLHDVAGDIAARKTWVIQLNNEKEKTDVQ